MKRPQRGRTNPQFSKNLKTFAEYDVVKLVKLNQDNRPFSGTTGVSRFPQIGDLGTIVHVYETGKLFTVEKGDSNDYKTWLADFTADELEPA